MSMTVYHGEPNGPSLTVLAALFETGLDAALVHIDLAKGQRHDLVFAQQPEVRTAFVELLLSDSNQGLRTQAIDLLTKGANVDRQTIGTLQELMQRGEQQGYVRERCRRVLEAMNASAETF